MSQDTLAHYFTPILYDFHDGTALVHRTGFRAVRYTYLDLYDYAHRMANWYQHNGLQKGDAVLLWAPNGPEWVAALLGCALSGVVAVPLDLRVPAEFVQHIAQETGTQVGIASRYQQTPQGVKWWSVEDLPHKVWKAPPTFRQPELKGEDVLEVVYTSGTTAEPKGVVLTNRNIVSNIRSVSQVLSLEKDWRYLSILPLSHMFEQTVGLFIPLFYGCSITYVRTRKSSVLLQTMKEERITSIVTVPLMLQTLRERIRKEARMRRRGELLEKMLRLAERVPLEYRRLLFGSLHRKLGGCMKFFAVGGAPLEREVEDFWNAVGVKVVQGYGLTETAPIVTCNTIAAPRAGTLGRVLPGQQLKLSRDGEILVKGENVTQGYYRRPDLTGRYFEDGWYRTGDVGELDAEGYLRIRGRTKNMILTASGMNVYPEDIEAELNRHPEVKEACVVPLERQGRTVIHAVLLMEERGAEAKAVIEKANARLADHQKVQSWGVWPKPDFPRTPTLKVQRRFVVEELKREDREVEETVPTAPTPLRAIIGQTAGVPARELVSDATLGLDLQIDSLRRVELVGIVEEELGVEIDEAKVTDRTTVEDLERLVASQERARPHRVKRWPLRTWAVALRGAFQYGLLYPLARYNFKLRVMGRENPTAVSKPFLLVANHTSHLDAVVLTLALPWHVRRRIAVAAAADTFEQWDAGGASFGERIGRRALTAMAVLGLNIFPFQRFAGIKKSLEYAGGLMDKGWSVMIFPEGRFSRDGTVQDFKPGAGLLVRELNVPVVPAKIVGAYEVMDYRHLWPKRGRTITIRFGSPLTFGSDDAYEDIAIRLEHEVRFL